MIITAFSIEDSHKRFSLTHDVSPLDLRKALGRFLCGKLDNVICLVCGDLLASDLPCWDFCQLQGDEGFASDLVLHSKHGRVNPFE